MSTPQIDTLEQAIAHAYDVLAVVGGVVPPTAELFARLNTLPVVLRSSEGLAPLQHALRPWAPLLAALAEARVMPMHIPAVGPAEFWLAQQMRDTARITLLQVHSWLDAHRQAPADDRAAWSARHDELVQASAAAQQALGLGQAALERVMAIAQAAFAAPDATRDL